MNATATPAAAATHPTTHTTNPTASHAVERIPVRVPLLDLCHGDKEIVVLLELPGVAQEDLDLTVENQVLTIRGRSQPTIPAGHRAIHQEFTPAIYERRLELGTVVDAERIAATLRNGLLRVVLPKASAVLPRRIAVSAGSETSSSHAA